MNISYWFLNREKTNSDVYNEVHTYLYQTKHPRTFINCRFVTAHPLNIHSYVLIVNKAPQVGVTKKIQPQKIGPCKILYKPTMVAYKLKVKLSHFIRKNSLFKSKWRSTSPIVPCYDFFHRKR